jgi:hypothetical protein
MTTKTLDSKGRLALGNQYAGTMVIVDDSNPDCIMIKPAVAIPTSEAWLYENDEALALVRMGLKQASEGDFSDSAPDLDADEQWASDIDD